MPFLHKIFTILMIYALFTQIFRCFWTENQNPQRFSLFGCMHRLNIALLYCRCNQMRFSDICGTKSLTFISRMSKQRNKIPDAGEEEQCGICGDPCHSIPWAWSRGDLRVADESSQWLRLNPNIWKTGFLLLLLRHKKYGHGVNPCGW